MELDEQKLELVEEANDENDDVSVAVVELQNRPVGEIDLWKADLIGKTGPLDLLEDVAIEDSKIFFDYNFLEEEKEKKEAGKRNL